MKKLCLLALVSAAPLFSQRNAIDWPSLGNDAQRTGWEKSDSSITKDNVKTFQLVMKMSLDPKLKGDRSLSSPVVLGRIISYRGFKELAFVESADDHLWAIDADMNRIFWEKTFEKAKHTPKSKNPACAESVVSVPALTPPAAFGSRGRGGSAPSAAKSLLSAAGFGAARPVFSLSNDGKLHLLNTSTGEDAAPPMTFLPNGAKATSLTALNGVVYTTTNSGCGGAPNAIWAIDLNGEEAKVNSFPTSNSGIVFGADGTVYAQTPESVIALHGPELKPGATFKGPAGLSNTTPVFFKHHDHEWLVTGTKEGRLIVLDPKDLTQQYETNPIGNIGEGISSWQDTDGTRWVLAANASPDKGAIVAFRFDDQGGKPTLTQAWVSREMQGPQAPVITAGVVFALASSPHATLYAFDGSTGQEIYSTGDQVTVPANRTGVTLANGRVYFTTTDGTLYAFGIYLER
jgi:outer membrane protein assembly factor BamB